MTEIGGDQKTGRCRIVDLMTDNFLDSRFALIMTGVYRTAILEHSKIIF